MLTIKYSCYLADTLAPHRNEKPSPSKEGQQKEKSLNSFWIWRMNWYPWLPEQIIQPPTEQLSFKKSHNNFRYFVKYISNFSWKFYLVVMRNQQLRLSQMLQTINHALDEMILQPLIFNISYLCYITDNKPDRSLDPTPRLELQTLRHLFLG